MRPRTHRILTILLAIAAGYLGIDLVGIVSFQGETNVEQTPASLPGDPLWDRNSDSEQGGVPKLEELFITPYWPKAPR